MIHPINPMIPTVHANFRFFQLMDKEGSIVDGWFGGGADLTPYYLFEEDAVHFHQTLKDACDRHNPSYYLKFRDWCDRYFRNHHRKEQRGIGGIFFDHLRLSEEIEANNAHQAFVEDAGNAFLPAYLPIVEQRQSMPYTPEQKKWQEIRRGRYVEFNLIHDRALYLDLSPMDVLNPFLCLCLQLSDGLMTFILSQAVQKPNLWMFYTNRKHGFNLNFLLCPIPMNEIEYCVNRHRFEKL